MRSGSCVPASVVPCPCLAFSSYKHSVFLCSACRQPGAAYISCIQGSHSLSTYALQRQVFSHAWHMGWVAVLLYSEWKHSLSAVCVANSKPQIMEKLKLKQDSQKIFHHKWDKATINENAEHKNTNWDYFVLIMSPSCPYLLLPNHYLPSFLHPLLPPTRYWHQTARCLNSHWIG